MTKFHCPNCDTINEVEPQHDAENEAEYLKQVAVEIEDAKERERQHIEFADAISIKSKMTKTAQSRFREAYKGRKFKNANECTGRAKEFLADRYSDLTDVVVFGSKHPDDVHFWGYDPPESTYCLHWEHFRSKGSDFIKWNYVITCPICNNQKKFWKTVDNTEKE